jgi:hypothetical protein
LGLKTFFGRRNAEDRIKRRVTSSTHRQIQPSSEDQLEDTLSHYQNQATRLAYYLYNNTQSRKSEGKQILKSSIKQGIGITARTILGPRKNHATQKVSSPKPTTKIATPNLNRKSRRK